MITAKEARSVSEDLKTRKCQDILTQIDHDIRQAAALGDCGINIVKYAPTQGILTHLETLGYICNVQKDQYDVLVTAVLKW